MADKVQYVLDRMSSVFHKLIELKLFSETEVSSIISRRRDLEYVINRRQLQPSDYYSYIQYEVNLFKLYRLRIEKHKDPTLIKQQRHIEALMIRHTSYVFERAIRRFPAENDLWMDYISFLKSSGSMTLLGNVLGKAIALYPKSETFWSLSAMHEIEANANTHAARVLLQRGLRVNANSKALWKQYFQVELWNALKIIERQNALGVPFDALALLEVVAVVFRHAVGATDDVDFAVELYQEFLSLSPPEYIVDVSPKFEMVLKQKFGSDSKLLVHLSTTQGKAALEAAASGKTVESAPGPGAVIEVETGENSSSKSKKRKLELASEQEVQLDPSTIRAMEVFAAGEQAILKAIAYFEQDDRTGEETIKVPISDSHISAFSDAIQAVLGRLLESIPTLVVQGVTIGDLTINADAAKSCDEPNGTSKTDLKSSQKKKKKSKDVEQSEEVSNVIPSKCSAKSAMQGLLKSCQKALDWIKVATETINSGIGLESSIVLLRLHIWLVQSAMYKLVSKDYDIPDEAIQPGSSEPIVQSAQGWTIGATLNWVIRSANSVGIQYDTEKFSLVAVTKSTVRASTSQESFATDIGGWSSVVGFLLDLCEANMHTQTSSDDPDTDEDQPLHTVRRQRSSASKDLLSETQAYETLVKLAESSLIAATVASSLPVGDAIIWRSVQLLQRIQINSWEIAVQNIIQRCRCTPESRGLWCLRYLILILDNEERRTSHGNSIPSSPVKSPTKHADSDSDSSAEEDSPKKRAKVTTSIISGQTTFKTLFAWLENEFRRAPHSTKADALGPYYAAASQEAIARLTEVKKQANPVLRKFGGITKSQNGSSDTLSAKSLTAKFESAKVFARSVVERGVAVCPNYPELWDALEKLEAMVGDLKSLNHVRWRRSKIGSM